MTKQAIQQTAHRKASEKDEWKRSEEKANLFKNRFGSGGEENERRMANNVMQETRVYDGYLVCLDLAQISPATALEILLATS